MVNKKLISLIFSILLMCCSAFGILLETPQIKGARVKVENHPDPETGIFTFNEITTRKSSVVCINRHWYYRNGIRANKGKGKDGLPRELLGCKYYLLPVQEELTYEVLSDGELYAVAPCNSICDRTQQLKKIGFERVPHRETFHFFDDKEENISALYKRSVKKGDKFKIPRPWCFIAGIIADSPAKNGEVLYNGIAIPRQWPPKYLPNKDGKWWPDGERPMPVPYLEKKPPVINISIGRQLFVDDFLIAEGSGFSREFHAPKKYSGNPVLKPETPLEKGKFGNNKMSGAAPKDGGVWWNPDLERFEAWYETGWCGTYAFAISSDGLNWERPDLGIFDEPNQIMPDNMCPDSGGVVLDYQSPDPEQRYKMFNRGAGDFFCRGKVWTSRDGQNWGKAVRSGAMGDRSTMFYNPFRKKWIFSLRWAIPHSTAGRARAYVEADDFMSGARWQPEDPVYWLGTDKYDLKRDEIKDSIKPELYNFNAVAYESIMLGMFQILWGPENDTCAERGHPKFTSLEFGYSRDGFHWSRPDRKPAIDSSRSFSRWDNGYVQSVGGICTVHGDKLYIYYIAFRGDPNNVFDPKTSGKDSQFAGMYDNSAMGVAIMRRDGFASLNSKSKEEPALILTEPVLFSGSHLFANIDAPDGALYAEVLDMDGKVIEPFSFKNCMPAKGNDTAARIMWKGASSDLSRLANKPVRFRFKMDSGKFYSFWVSVSENGRSDGYVAAGGPGFHSNIDNVGKSKK